ncbi:hypothetical protein P4V13_26230 [Brevibacillus agri]|uniref:hypothetical protein n=1 Tax=Brevibacillus agri TaxID=51101 RepID=UPI002E215AAD|nr:hypothetical protein [Brevibacillus agri]
MTASPTPTWASPTGSSLYKDNDTSACREKYGLVRGKKVGFLCQNHMALVKAIFAASGHSPLSKDGKNKP